MTIFRDAGSCGNEELMLKEAILKNITLTEVTVEDEERRNVEQQTQEFSDDHQIVPCANGQCNHQQLSEDKSGERNRHNVNEVVLKQKQCAEHQNAT